MPARNSIKQYYENGYYHIYNRGVEKRKIFLEEQDYSVFLSYLKNYLLPKNEGELMDKLVDPSVTLAEKDKARKLLRMNNFSKEITLIAYCLMPNHFHFFVKQKSRGSIDKFMNSLGTRYTMYFNKKYKRVGRLYQGVYKAVSVENEPQFLYLSKYIHKQALDLRSRALQSYKNQQEQPSSFKEYIGKRQTEWIDPSVVLSYFSDTNPEAIYENFVKEPSDEVETNTVNKLIIED
jgi:putative transposase